MANPKHLKILEQGVEKWNQWRKSHHPIIGHATDAALTQAVEHLGSVLSGGKTSEQPDLSSADLSGGSLRRIDFRNCNLHQTNFEKAHLERANFCRADLREANLRGVRLDYASLAGADLRRADLRGAVLQETEAGGANLRNADLRGAELPGTSFACADLCEADLRGADMIGVDLSQVDLRDADLRGANLEFARLWRTTLDGADLSNCRIHGIAAWDVSLEDAGQSDLVITRLQEPTITVDNVEVAQFVYLLLNNERIRDVIDTITSKVVLILGRFTAERKPVLDAIREELRHRDYLPILFDFEKPSNRDLTETISTLAHMARFVIADITDAKSIPQELSTIVPALPSVPVKPMLLASQTEYGMFEHLRRYPWVLDVFSYQDTAELLSSFTVKVIEPAEAKRKQLAAPKSSNEDGLGKRSR